MMNLNKLLKEAAQKCEGEFLSEQGGVYSFSYVMRLARSRVEALEAPTCVTSTRPRCTACGKYLAPGEVCNHE